MRKVSREILLKATFECVCNERIFCFVFSNPILRWLSLVMRYCCERERKTHFPKTYSQWKLFSVLYSVYGVSVVLKKNNAYVLDF